MKVAKQNSSKSDTIVIPPCFFYKMLAFPDAALPLRPSSSDPRGKYFHAVGSAFGEAFGEFIQFVKIDGGFWRGTGEE